MGEGHTTFDITQGGTGQSITSQKPAKNTQTQRSVEISHTVGRFIDTTRQNIDSTAVLFGSIILYKIDILSAIINGFIWILYANKIISKHKIEGI